jgi:hypothetical protein
LKSLHLALSTSLKRAPVNTCNCTALAARRFGWRSNASQRRRSSSLFKWQDFSAGIKRKEREDGIRIITAAPDNAFRTRYTSKLTRPIRTAGAVQATDK